jgi:hypothetical protein
MRAADRISHAEAHAYRSPSGVGAATVETEVRGAERQWLCVVSDGQTWHYVPVIGSGVGPAPDISPEDVEHGIEDFAATLPAPNRLQNVINASPLHIHASGRVTD